MKIVTAIVYVVTVSYLNEAVTIFSWVIAPPCVTYWLHEASCVCRHASIQRQLRPTLNKGGVGILPFRKWFQPF